jgi:arsenate reductase
MTTIYHNPACSVSRRTLALLRANGVEPTIVEYLKTPPDKATLAALLADLEMQPSAFMRRKSKLVEELGLNQSGVPEFCYLAAMVSHPELIERPIVVTARGVRIGRPPEAVLEILE